MDVQVGPSGPYLPQVNPPEAAPPTGPLRGGKSRKKFWIVVGAFLAFVLLILGYIFWQAFDLWLGQRRVVQVAEQLQKAQEEFYQKQLADTYGGKTPQETLRIFIEAVEKGDYELAGKYFVIEKQKEWENTLQETKVENRLETFLLPLRAALDSQGEYSEDKKEFSIYEPIGIDFILYPNNIWKIVEI